MEKTFIELGDFANSIFVSGNEFCLFVCFMKGNRIYLDKNVKDKYLMIFTGIWGVVDWTKLLHTAKMRLQIASRLSEVAFTLSK